MGLVDSGDSSLMRLRVTSTHKRSKSFPEERIVEECSFDGSIEASPDLKVDMVHIRRSVAAKKKHPSDSKAQNTLKHEILELEKRLQSQVVLCHAREKAMACGSVSIEEPSTLRPATELIREIAVLELEVLYLEQHLLSLYRKTFDQPQQVYPISPVANDKRTMSSAVMTPRRLFVNDAAVNSLSKIENATIFSAPRSLSNIWTERRGTKVEDKMLDSGVRRCHSSLSHRFTFERRNSSTVPAASRGLQSCHSHNLSMMEYDRTPSSKVTSLAELLGTRISDHIPEMPNRISEDMVKCMAAIFCRLGEPHSMHDGLLSPSSYLTSLGGSSPPYPSNDWSSGFSRDLSLDTHLDNPFNVEGLKEYSGPYSSMVEVQCIYPECQKLGDVERMLQKFRSLIGLLEEIDPKTMRHEEKLAFWINIHNALVMHAFLAYGIPENGVKRISMILKAAYNVGGRTISAETIQSTILGCRMSRPGQWLWALLPLRTKFKTGDQRQSYSIEHPEPLVRFALCSGSHSDPVLRVYTSKRVFLELEEAREDYIRAALSVCRDCKIRLPKLMELFAKDANLCPAGLNEMIQQSLPDPLKMNWNRYQLRKSGKNIEWIPHDFAFRYLISKELVKKQN